MKIIGTKWFKCDFHAHTTESACFTDREVTPEQWVQAAIDKKLDCIAVTDHNTGNGIDKIKEAAKDTGLVVFPGVELTCSDAKVHILVLFDINKGTTEVNDFIIKAGIDRQDFGKSGIQSSKSVEDIIQIASNAGALVIPAHIDGRSGLCDVANSQRETILKNTFINGVQFINKQLDVEQKNYNKAEVLAELRDIHGKWITEEILKKMRQTVVQAQKEGLSFLTFSDNPYSEGNSKHGLWGIGNSYTWIKMDVEPSLESLRQALLLPKFRIKNCFEVSEEQTPYELPDTWIESIKIENTQITSVDEPVEIHFSPQMNTFIGGRGSGKSSLLKFIRGVFTHKVRELHDIESLEVIKDDFENFFKLKDRKDQGVLNNGSRVEVILNRNTERFKLVRVVSRSKVKDTEVFKQNKITGDFEKYDSEGFIDLIDIDIFSQKQIYEIGTKTNSLRSRIDKLVPEISEKQKEIDDIVYEYKNKAKQLREIQKKTADIPSIETQIKDLESQIETFNKSGVKELASETKMFVSERKAIKRFAQDVEDVEIEIETLINGINIEIPEEGIIDDKYNDDIKKILKDTVAHIVDLKKQLNDNKKSAKEIHTSLIDNINKSQWKIDEGKINSDFESKKQELADNGVEDLSKIADLIKQVESKKEQLKELEIEKAKIPNMQTELSDIKDRHFKERQSVTVLRREFLGKTLKSDKVKASVKPFRDLSMVENSYRKIMNNNSGFDDDYKELNEIWEGRDTKSVNRKICKIFNDLRNDKRVDGFDGRFMRNVKGLNNEAIDNISLFYPEDDIEIKYKKDGDSSFRSISNASAGQKSASILTLLLSHGVGPLILDQPEDDLDNYLIYDLVVEQLRLSKDKRQIIVVTHNANVPVNGDSEHMIVMNSESSEISTKIVGTIENEEIKKEICTIMEGGTEAFNMRSKRYIGLN